MASSTKLQQQQQLSFFFTIFFFLSPISSSIHFQKLKPYSLLKPNPFPPPIHHPNLKPNHHPNLKPNLLLTLPLLHTDSFLATSPTLSPLDLLRRRLLRDSVRAKSISSSATTSNNTSTNPQPHGFTSPVISGYQFGGSDYLAIFGLGSQRQQLAMIVDTGSDLTWTQCTLCHMCYPQYFPIFDPSLSTTFHHLSCLESSKNCYNSCLDDDLCTYVATYLDTSFSYGILASEILTFGQTALDQVIGCGHSNKLAVSGPSGILAMGRGRLSFPSQISPLIGGMRFTYCMAYYVSNSTSWLSFGGSETTEVAIRLLVYERMPSFYFVALTGVVVGGERVSVGRKTEVGGAMDGVIFDSGTLLTRLVMEDYVAVRDVFRKGMEAFVFTGSFSEFDTCYDLSGMEVVRVPTVEFEFEGVKVSLPAENYMVSVDESGGVHCFALVGTTVWPSIIGNTQFQGFLVVYDLAGSTLGLSRNVC